MKTLVIMHRTFLALAVCAAIGITGVTLAHLVDYSRAHNARFVLVRPDTQLLPTLKAYDTLDAIGEDNIFPTLDDAFRAYQTDPGTTRATASDQ